MAVKEQESETGRAYVVGPMAPAEQFDRMDAEAKDRYEKLNTVRSTIVTIGKRMGTIKALEAPAAEAPTTTGTDDDEDSFGRTDLANDTIEPPFDFSTMATIFENSSSLRQNIDAMVTNVDGFGHQFVPVLDFSQPDIDDVIRDLLLRKTIEENENPEDLMDLTDEQISTAMPSAEEVQATKKRWKTIATIEKGRIESFFEFINPIESFTEVRKKMRNSRELMGNAAWEILREDPSDHNSRISQVYNVPFANIRLLRADRKAVEVDMTIRKDAVHYDTIRVNRYFRRFVRMVAGAQVYYKQFGDPRVVSRKTGQIFKTLEDLKAEEGEESKPAHELYHWVIDSPISAYGIPRWIGVLLAILGNRASEDVNFLFFDNKAIPPMVLLVSGGRVSEDSVSRIQTMIDERIKGRENFHNILIIEGLPAGSDPTEGDLEASGKLRFELRPLMKEMQQDALFQDYEANNMLKVGRSFRQPQLLTGDTRDMNRSTAEVAKAFAEEQIYQPERDEFDAVMDRHFITNLKIHFWRFKTNAPVQRIPNDLVENVRKSMDVGAITANEARGLLSDAFSKHFPWREEEWARTPPKLALQATRQGSVAAPAGQTRAADQVQPQEGDLIARGQTSEVEGHAHRFVIERSADGGFRAVLFTGGEDNHVHQVEVPGLGEGDVAKITTSESVGHSHEISFTAPLSKRTQQLMGFAAMVNSLRDYVMQDVEAAKDEFFDASRWNDPEE